MSGDCSERWIGVWWFRWAITRLLIGGAVVTVQLREVVAFKGGGELLEELVELCGRLVGEIGRQTHER